MTVSISEVRKALEQDEVIACFQPLVDLRSGRLTGFEVLARWRHPEHGLILPPDFIPLIEEHGLAGQLMQNVLRHAFQATPLLLEPLILSVNISPTQLQDLTLPAQIRQLAEAGGFPLKRLAVEITETALLNSQQKALTIMRSLKTMGCRLALDDFGTGYSSLSYLQTLPFDELKIDRSFISSMTEKRESRKIVATIIGLAHSLNLITVAEGVETKEQAHKLLWLGCEQAQGWLYGRPVTVDAIPALVAAEPRALAAILSPTLGGDFDVASLEALPMLRRSQLQAIYDGAPVGLCFLDCNFRYVSLNHKLAEMNGASIGDHLGRTVQQMLPNSFAAIEPYLIRALHGEVIIEMELTKTWPGSGRSDSTVLASFQPAWDDADEVVGISIASMDITQRKHSETALQESEDLHRHMYELNPQIPWIMDRTGNSIEINARWREVMGVDDSLAHALGWIDAVHPSDIVSTRETMQDSLLTGKLIDIQYRVKNLDGVWKWVRSRGAPRFDDLGEITRWYGIVEDIPLVAVMA